MDEGSLDPATIVVSAGRGARRPGDPVNAPVTFASVYRAGGEIAYGREGNPTWEALEEALGSLWVESPTNPLLGVADLPALTAGAHARGVPMAVDNTLATPLVQRPLEHGADVVVAHRLATHPAINRVRYPGLPEDPGHRRAARQTRGFGALVSAEVVGGRAAADAVCDAVRLLVPATSLGGLETSLERRNRVPGEQEVPAALLRISVGCEHIYDLWEDLRTALSVATSAVERPPAEGHG